MWHYEAIDVNDYYDEICHDLMENGKSASPRGRNTKELHPTIGIIYQPRKRIMTCHGRVINLPFVLAEVLQILGGGNDAQMLSFYNSSIIDIQGDGPRGSPHWQYGVMRFNAGYGERLRAYHVGANASSVGPMIDQLDHVIQTLKRDHDSRQASIVLSHPGDDNYTVNTVDRACNVYAHPMIRDGRLNWMQVIRSNDAVWGIPYNFVQWSHVQEWVATAVGVPMGHMFIVQDSFHVYEEKYEECRAVKLFDLYDYLQIEPAKMHCDEKLIGELMLQEVRVRGGVRFSYADIFALNESYGIYWSSVLQVLHSYAHFKRNDSDAAWETLPDYPELRLPLVRMYCHYRWAKSLEKYQDLLERAVAELAAYQVPVDEAKQWLGIEPILSSA